MRCTFTSWPAVRRPARRLAAFGAGLLGLGLLTGCPQEAPPAAAVNTNPIYEVVADTVYTGNLQVAIPSPGTYSGGRRVPDLMLSVCYRQDPKTGDLEKGTTLFIVEGDGLVMARLKFPDHPLTTKVVHRVCYFQVNVDFVFGAGVANSFGISVSENPAAEQGEEGPVQDTASIRGHWPGPHTVIHARIVGLLNVRTKTLEAVAETTGPAELLVRH